MAVARLGKNIYNMVLSDFLQLDPLQFQQTVKEWPVELSVPQKSQANKKKREKRKEKKEGRKKR
jgi:hypothetical protein